VDDDNDLIEFSAMDNEKKNLRIGFYTGNSH